MPTLVTYITDCVCRRQAGPTKHNKKCIIPLGGEATSPANIWAVNMAHSLARLLTLDVFPLGDDGEDGLGTPLVPEVVVPGIGYWILNIGSHWILNWNQQVMIVMKPALFLAFFTPSQCHPCQHLGPNDGTRFTQPFSLPISASRVSLQRKFQGDL